MVVAKKVAPPPRARALNLSTEPNAEPAHIRHGRAAYRANKAKNKFTKIEKDEKLEAHMAMAALKLGNDEFEEEGRIIQMVIAGGSSKSVDMTKFYEAVTSGKIKIEQFVACVSASQDAIKRELGSNFLAGVLITSAKEATLTISEKK